MRKWGEEREGRRKWGKREKRERDERGSRMKMRKKRRGEKAPYEGRGTARTRGRGERARGEQEGLNTPGILYGRRVRDVCYGKLPGGDGSGGATFSWKLVGCGRAVQRGEGRGGGAGGRRQGRRGERAEEVMKREVLKR